jgi:hypothetical protein
VSDVFLGIIAASVLVMALIQVAVIVLAARAAKQMSAAVSRLDQDIRPLITNLQAMTAEAARASAIAAAQVERADRLFTEMSARLDETLTTVQTAVVGATRGGAWLAGIKAAFAALRDMRAPRRPATVDEEDALFIG